MKQVMSYVLIIVIFFLLASLWGFYISIKPPSIKSDIIPANYGLNYEEITFKTKDDLNLSGWFIPHEEKEAKTIILLHGYPADKGDILPATRFLHEKYNLFLFDFRYLGASEGKYSTVGIKETEDLSAAIRFLKSRGINEVGVWGFSMGGAVALMTAPEAPEIKAIISDSAYASLELMSYELYRMPFIRYPLGWLTGVWSKLLLGIDVKKTSPKEAVKNLSIPILIIHSEEDKTIPFKNAEILQESLKGNPKAEFWFDGRVTHGQSAKDHQKIILDFFERNFKG